MPGGPIGALFGWLFRALGSSAGRSRPRPPQTPAANPYAQPEPPPAAGGATLRPLSFNASKFRAWVPSAAVGRMVIYLDGALVFDTAGAHEFKRTWSSVCRTVNALAWGTLFADGRLTREDLRRPLAELVGAFWGDWRREDISPQNTLAELLSTTIGGRFRYSGGDAWLANHDCFQVIAGRRMPDAVNDRILAPLGLGPLADELEADGTMRINGSCHDLIRIAELMRHRGRTPDGRELVPAWYVDLMVAGGTHGDGHPDPREGYQTHLWRHGRHSESRYKHPDTGQVTDFVSLGVPDGAYFAYGAVDRAVVAVVPSLRLSIARHNSNHGYPIDTFLEAACLAVEAR